jgi:hypothetical protein
MGRVHVRAWQAAYRGQMPDDYRYSTAPAQQLLMAGLTSADRSRDGQDRFSVTSAVQVEQDRGR